MCCLAIVPKKVREEGDKKVPVEFEELLDKYKEIIIDDMPMGVPLTRSISHQIYFIPGSILPNKAPYRMTPLERKRLIDRLKSC